MKIALDRDAMAVLLQMLENIARMLEAGYDPQKVARDIREFVAETDAKAKQ